MSSRFMDSIGNSQRKLKKFYQRGPQEMLGKSNYYQNQSQSSGNIQFFQQNLKHLDDASRLQNIVSNTSIFTTETTKSSKIYCENNQNSKRQQRFLSKQSISAFGSQKFGQKQVESHLPSFLSISPKIKDIQQNEFEQQQRRQDKKFKSFLSSLHIQYEQRNIEKISEKLKSIISHKYIPLLEKSNLNTQEYHQAKGLVESLVQETGKYQKKQLVSLESIQSTRNINTLRKSKVKQQNLIETNRNLIEKVDNQIITVDRTTRHKKRKTFFQNQSEKLLSLINENEVIDPDLIQHMEKVDYFFQDLNNNLFQIQQNKAMNNLDNMNGFTEEIRNLIYDKSFKLSQNSWSKLFQNFLSLQNIPSNLRPLDKLEIIQTSNLFRKLIYFNSQVKTLLESKLQQQMNQNEKNVINLQESFIQKIRSYSFKALKDIEFRKQLNFGQSLLNDLKKFQEQHGPIFSLKSAEIIRHQLIDETISKRNQFS